MYLSNGRKDQADAKKIYFANVLEALIGAIYSKHGYDNAEKFIERFILKRLDDIISSGKYIDAKSQFQEMSQEKEEFTPYYEVIEEHGPDHDKNFVMGLI